MPSVWEREPASTSQEKPRDSSTLDPSCSTCLASASIGYSVAATPIQLAAVYAAVANDGVWIQPHLVKALRGER